MRAAEQERRFWEGTTMRALDDLIVRGNDFSDVMRNVAQAIASAALQASILGTGPLAGLMGTGGGGGLLGAIGGLFGGAFAIGGTLPAGQWGIVGERGPEPIQAVPGGGVRILPNSRLGQVGGGVSISMSTTIDARGSQIGEAELGRILDRRDRALVERIVPVVRDAQERTIL